MEIKIRERYKGKTNGRSGIVKISHPKKDISNFKQKKLEKENKYLRKS
jgi:hypothetical protein